MDLAGITAKLNARRQRATYGAVAGIVGGIPRGLMAGRERSYEYSWVVAKKGLGRGRPTGYSDNQIHPECLQQIHEGLDNLIEDEDTLRQWLSS